MLREGQEIAIGLLATVNEIDDGIHLIAQCGYRLPPQGVAGAHQEAACRGAGQLSEPHEVELRIEGSHGQSGFELEVAHYLLVGEGVEEVADVVVHDSLEEASFEGDSAHGNPGFDDGGMPLIGGDDVAGGVGDHILAVGPQRTCQSVGVIGR